MEEVNTAEVAEFLSRYPPFSSLAPEALERVAGRVEERAYEAGETILVEDATPADHLFVVRSGAVALVHQEEVVDVLEPGESFGHPSLLTGMAPAFTVRAHEDSVCYLLAREEALAVLGSPDGAGYIASSLRERLTRAGHTVHALPSLSATRVGELISRAPIFCPGSILISAAARTMTEFDVSAMLVRDGERLFVLSDAVLRSRVVTGEVSAENPVSRVVAPAVIVGPERLAVDAVVDLLDGGADHLVVVDRARKVLGVLSATDLMGVETRSPFALRHAILRARDEDELVEASSRLGRLFLALLEANLSPIDIGRVLSLQVDSITMRLIDLAIERIGPAPVAWAWLALGSAARREFTLGSDQENALAYDGSAGDEGLDAYFAQLAEEVNRGLARCGFAPDPNDVAATSPLWRMAESDWVEVFRACLESPDRSHLIRANVSFDFRQVSGGLDAAPPLVEVLRDAKNHPDFLRRIARSATDFKPPLGFRGSLGSGEIDLKQGGVIPLANMARFFAFANGITISSTLDRLAAAEQVGALDAETAAGLQEAFAAIARVRLDHHATRLAEGAAIDNVVEPGRLPPLTRAQLRDAFREIAKAQKRLSVYVPLGI